MVFNALIRLATEEDIPRLLVLEQMFDNALISAGLLDDPAKMVQRIYKILETA